MAGGKDFLNLFAYTGSASDHAAVGGARSTTTVDMSNTYLERAKENMELNGQSLVVNINLFKLTAYNGWRKSKDLTIWSLLIHQHFKL